MFGGEDQKIHDMIHQNSKNKKTKKKVNMIFKRQVSSRFIDDLYVQGDSLYLFKRDNEFRQFLFRLVSSEKFEQSILIFILLSAVGLAFNNPLNDPNGPI